MGIAAKKRSVAKMRARACVDAAPVKSVSVLASQTMSENGVTECEFKPQEGQEMRPADEMGVLNDADLLGSDANLEAAFERFENDPRFDREKIEKRLAERAERAKASASSTASTSNSTAPSSIVTGSEGVPDVIMFGFCKIVFSFVSALKVRFPRRTMIQKTYEVFWQIAEQAPAMPYERFRDLVYNVGVEQVQAKADDKKLQRKVAKLSAKAAGDDLSAKAEAEESLRQLFAQHTLQLFEERAAQRKKLPANESDVSAEANKRLFDTFEEPLLRHAVQIPLFKMAKLDRVWCDRLDLTTRDRTMEYMHRMCKVTNLIDNFDPTMKQLINSVSIDSLNAAQGKSKGEIDFNALLDELQQRVLNDDEFLDKVSEIAQKQARGL